MPAPCESHEIGRCLDMSSPITFLLELLVFFLLLLAKLGRMSLQLHCHGRLIGRRHGAFNRGSGLMLLRLLRTALLRVVGRFIKVSEFEVQAQVFW